MPSLWQRLREWWMRGNIATVSEETIMAEDFARLDKEQPGWDRGVKVAMAQATLIKSGYSREFTVKIYGEDIVREAEANILKKQGRNS